MRTKVDKEGIPYIIQDAVSKWPDIFEFKLFDGRVVMLTHESVECHLHPLPTEFAHNLVRYNEYKGLNDLLGEWVLEMRPPHGRYTVNKDMVPI